MSGRHQPERGADSPDQRRPFDVYLVSRDDDDARPRAYRVPCAFGPNDARNQALDAFPSSLVLDVREAPMKEEAHL